MVASWPCHVCPTVDTFNHHFFFPLCAIFLCGGCGDLFSPPLIACFVSCVYTTVLWILTVGMNPFHCTGPLMTCQNIMFFFKMVLTLRICLKPFGIIIRLQKL